MVALGEQHLLFDRARHLTPNVLVRIADEALIAQEHGPSASARSGRVGSSRLCRRRRAAACRCVRASRAYGMSRGSRIRS